MTTLVMPMRIWMRRGRIWMRTRKEMIGSLTMMVLMLWTMEKRPEGDGQKSVRQHCSLMTRTDTS